MRIAAQSVGGFVPDQDLVRPTPPAISLASRSKPNSIEVTVGSPRRLFHELDPSPLIGRDLDEQVESYILACARELRTPPFRLVLHVPPGELPTNREAAAQIAAIKRHFAGRRDQEALKLRSLLREGRQTLVVGLVFLFICGIVGWIALRGIAAPLGGFLEEGLLIIGWVALWRPVEILLYDWRPIRRERRMLDQLSEMAIEFRPLGAD